MKLAINFRILKSTLTGYRSLIAAPVIEVSPPQPMPAANGTSPQPPFIAFPTRRIPSATTTLANKGDYWEWPYDPAPANVSDPPPGIRAYANECLLAVSSGDDSIIDLATLHAKAGFSITAPGRLDRGLGRKSGRTVRLAQAPAGSFA
jgi:hypothetical protein